MESLAVLGVTGIIIALSLWWKVQYYRSVLNEMEYKASPFSRAVQELVATAGGVYLSVIMLVSFLKIDIPSTVNFLSIYLDPIALLSIGIAVAQPIFFRILKKDK